MLSKVLILAIMAAESGGNPMAVSPSGAVGLLQITSVAKLEVEQQFPGVRSLNMLVPVDNITCGVLLLKHYSRFANNKEELLAAYNGGSRQMLNLREGRPLALETRRYIERVIELENSDDLLDSEYYSEVTWVLRRLSYLLYEDALFKSTRSTAFNRILPENINAVN